MDTSEVKVTLPILMQRLESQARTLEHIDEKLEVLIRLDERHESLARSVSSLTARIDRLATSVDDLESINDEMSLVRAAVKSWSPKIIGAGIVALVVAAIAVYKT
jgi:DNA repair ATPase RecN